MKIKYVFIILILTGLLACSSKSKFKISNETVEPGSKITWLGKEVTLTSQHKLTTNAPLQAIHLKGKSLKDITLKPNGKVSLISVIPSIDTPVCEVQTRELGENKRLNKHVNRITISMDLPYAQSRFQEKTKINNVLFLSDFENREFGLRTGLLIEEKGVLARALIVLDKKGVVRHYQVVPEILQMPNFEKAIKIANQLVTANIVG